jgi:hypothetical protein
MDFVGKDIIGDIQWASIKDVMSEKIIEISAK